MPVTKTHSIDMLQGPLLPKVLAFSLPLAASSLLSTLFNTINVIVVSKLAGNASLAAVGSATSVVNLLIDAFSGFAIGANVAIARHVGVKDDARAQRAVHTALTLSAVLGALLLCISLVCSGFLPRMMDTPEDILPLAETYLRIYSFGIPATLIYNFGAAVLRAVGDTKRPLIFLGISGVVNIVLSIVFVGLGLQIAGAGIAAAVSQCVSMVLVIRCLMKDSGPCRFRFSGLCLDRNEAGAIFRFGASVCLVSIAVRLTDIMLQTTVNSFGSAVVAADSAASSIINFTAVSVSAVSMAAISFTSQNYAAGSRQRVRQTLRACFIAVSIIAIPMSVLSYLFAQPLLGLFLDRADPNFTQLIQYGMIRMLIVGLPYALGGYMDVMCGMVRGFGDFWMSSLGLLVCMCLLRVVWLLGIFPMFPTLECVYLSFPASWILSLLAYAVCYLWIMKHRWFPAAREAVC